MNRPLAAVRPCLVTLLVIGASVAGSEPAPSVSAKASKSQVGVGESFVVEVTGTGPAGITWAFPDNAGNEEVELRALPVEPASAATEPEPPRSARRYAAAVFSLADATVPPIRVGYRLADGSAGEAATDPLLLHVASRLPKDPKEQKLVDIRAPVPLTVGRAFWIAMACAVLLLAIGAWTYRRRRRARLAPVPAPELPADAEAFAAFARLEASGFLTRGDYRGFYIGLTEAAKRYLERRLAAPVLEMTSAEMAAFLRGSEHGEAALPTMRDLSLAADRIKFARGDGLTDEAMRHLAGSREMITLLEARLKQPPAAGAEKVA